MSQNTLAAVSIDILANNASFLEGLSKSEASLKKSVSAMGRTVSGFGDALANTLGPLGGSIGAELSGIFSGVGSAVSEMASKISSAKGITGALAVGFAGLGTAAIAAAGALSTMAISGSELVDKLSNMSQMTGISIRDLQVLGAAGATANIPLESIVDASRKFSEALTGMQRGGANLDGMLKSLGVTSHDMNEALLEAADGFSKMQDGPLKSAYAVELFGRSGLQLIPLLNQGRAGLAEFSDMVDQFGPNVDANAIQATDKWQKSTEQLSLSWDRFKVSLSSGVGLLSKVVDGFSAAIKASGDLSSALAKHTRETLSGFAHGGLLGAVTSAELTNGTNAPANTAEQQAKLAAQNALIAKQKEMFQILQSGGEAEFALSQKKLDIQNAVEAGDFAHALALQKEIPALEAAADKEKQRLAAAKAVVAEHEKILALIEKQGSGQIKVTNVFRQIPKVAAPDLTQTTQNFEQIGESLQRLTNVGGVTDAVLTQGRDAIADFYTEWDHDNKNTIDVINQRFTDQLNNFKGLLELQAITQQQYNDVSKALETQRIAEIQKIQAKAGTNFAVSFASTFADIADQADKFAKNLADSIGGAVNDLSGQLASLATTGRANFAQIGQTLEGNVLRSSTSAVLGSATKHVAGLFGVQFGKPDGTQNNPIYTKSADNTVTDHTKALGKLNFGTIGKDISGAFKNIGSTLGSVFGKIGGGFASIFGSLFGGFKAGGGDVQPGQAYIVGERQPELFIPHAAGRIAPSVSPAAFAGGGHTVINNNFAFHGVADADSFKASKNQIMNHVANSVSRAVSRR